jgi:hypothetical protein
VSDDVDELPLEAELEAEPDTELDGFAVTVGAGDEAGSGRFDGPSPNESTSTRMPSSIRI